MFVPVNPRGIYTDVPTILSYLPEYTYVGGVNIPKKIKCRGSDGIVRKLLIKGKDDLRQDAVMQQVFTLMNKLLKADPDSRRRKLTVRTYNVSQNVRTFK